MISGTPRLVEPYARKQSNGSATVSSILVFFYAQPTKQPPSLHTHSPVHQQSIHLITSSQSTSTSKPPLFSLSSSLSPHHPSTPLSHLHHPLLPLSFLFLLAPNPPLDPFNPFKVRNMLFEEGLNKLNLFCLPKRSQRVNIMEDFTTFTNFSDLNANDTYH